jgi:hypothetical protein
MGSAQPPGNDVVQGQVAAVDAAVLAGKIISPEDLSLIQLHSRPGPSYHASQADDRRDIQVF